MKHKLKHLLSLIALNIAASVFAQTAPVEPTYWIRPVITPNDSAKVNEFKMDNVTYYLPVGVYVQVVDERNGDVILGGKQLATNSAPVTDYSKRCRITKAEFDKAEDLKKHLSVINDSLLAVDLKDLEGEGQINIYVRGQLVSSKPEYGKNDTLDLTTLGIKKAEGIIILAQDSQLSTYVKVEELQKVEMDFNIPVILEDVVEEKSEQSLDLWLIIVIIAVVIALAVFVFIKRDWIKGLFADGKKEDDKEKCQKALKKLTSTLSKAEKKLKKNANENQFTKFREAVGKCINVATKMNDLLDEKQSQPSSYIDLTKIIKESIETTKSVFNASDITEATDNILNQTQKLQELQTTWCNSGISGSGPNHETVKSEPIEETVARLEKEVKSLNTNLTVEKRAKESVQKELESVRGNLNELKKNQEEIINKKIAATNANAQKQINAANDRARKAESKAETIANDLNRKFNEEREQLKDEKKKLNETLDNTRKDLQTTIHTLRTTEDRLSKANRIVENLTAETESFHKHLSGVPDSKAYCNDIVKLLALAKNVQESAAALLKADIEDKYYIFKALALYLGKLDAINITALYADVVMISKTGFVIKGTPLATYDPNLPAAELQSLTKNYFFTTYLKNYFDALVVLNESIAGLNYLIDDVTSADLKVFAEYRGQIEAIAQKLGINILTVKIYDAAGSNTDLLATEVDADIEKHGAILEIENCKVSLIGGAPDNERIIVKIQK